MKLSIIAAMATNRVIGRENELPWHIPEDLKHFKETTMGHPIIMGRKTFESIGKPLPGRENIVFTRNAALAQDGVTVLHDLDALAQHLGDQEAFVIGGEAIYRLTLPHVQSLYLTMIDDEFEGDTYFPEIDWEKDFKIVEEGDLIESEESGLPYRFIKAVRHSSNDSAV